MTPVLSRSKMRELDAYASRTCGVPSLLLMENAGRGAASVLCRELLDGGPSGSRVLVVCGTGNNGGDGFAIARHLAVRGRLALVCLLGDPLKVTEDARIQMEAWRGIGGPVREVSPGAPLASLEEALGEAHVVVDALFGTGLDRPIEGWLAEAVRAMNRSPGKRFAVDLPSGLDADTGATLGVAVEAHLTATFAHPKLGLLTPNGHRLAGRYVVVDIGVPPALATHVASPAQLIEHSDLEAWLTPRAPGAYKTSAGHVLVLAGSPGRVGAPQLVARGALRAGAGLATIATWPEAAGSIEANVLEVMTARIDRREIAASLDAILHGKQSVVMGPGLGMDDDARIAVEYALATFRGPVVVDADALSMFAGRPSVFMAAPNAILTPHPGEAGRLLDRKPADIEGDRFRAVRELVAATGAVVVLKGAHTLIAAPDGRLAISPMAAPVLGTAGSGDTLGGIVGALACALPRFEAACAAVYLHALAGEAWSRLHGGVDRGLLASEISGMLPAVLANAQPTARSSRPSKHLSGAGAVFDHAAEQVADD